MSYNSSSGPFWIGTMMFAIFCGIALFLSKFAAKKGKNDYLGLSQVMIVMTAVCCWMMWAMAWLMQWHPLIVPIREAQDADSLANDN